MFAKVRQLFSSLWFRIGQRGINHRLDLEQLHLDLQEVIVRNELKLAENENLISTVLSDIKAESEKVKTTSIQFLKNAYLRKIRSAQNRINTLNRCSKIYHDNILMHTRLADRLEEMRVSGIKSIDADAFEEIVVDHQERYDKHLDAVNAVKSMHIEYEWSSDVDLSELEKEIMES